MSDLEIDKIYGVGSRGKKVRLIQEWLCLHGINVMIDGEFGPATESAVKRFQTEKGLIPSGTVDNNTFERLIDPMASALKQISPSTQNLGQLVVEYAQNHLKQHPREIGGENRGPWVRLYMNGHEGTQWRWCAGFVCFCLRQACKTLGVTIPIKPSFSCDSIAASAITHQRFLKELHTNRLELLTPGSFFLQRRTPTDWIHIGIVTQATSDILHTVEGNTNDAGSAEGFEVCARTRGYKNKDFVII